MAAKLASNHVGDPAADDDGSDPTTNYKVILLIPRPPALEGEMTMSTTERAVSVQGPS